MKKIRFLMRVVYCNLLHYRRMNIVLLISFVVGLLLPLVLVANVNVFIRSLGLIKVQQADKVVVFDVSGATMDESEWLVNLKQSGILVEDSSFVYIKSQLVETGVDEFLVNVRYSDLNLLNFENFKLTSPQTKDIFSTSNNSCIVENGFFARHKGISVGDSLVIEGQSYVIANSFTSMNYYGSVILDKQILSSAKEHLRSIYIRFSDTVDLEVIKSLKILLNEKTNINSIQSGEMRYFDDLKSGILQSSIILGVGLITMLLSIGNVTLLIIARAKRLSEQYKTQMALGAYSQDIILGQFFELFIFLVVALLIDALMMPPILATMEEGLDFVFSPMVYVVVGILFSIVLAFINYVVVKKTLRSSDV